MGMEVWGRMRVARRSRLGKARLACSHGAAKTTWLSYIFPELAELCDGHERRTLYMDPQQRISSFVASWQGNAFTFPL